MNTYLLIANVLCLLAFLAHSFAGDRELKLIEPSRQDGSTLPQEKWTMARAGWHMVSVDLLLATLALGLVNFSERITHELVVLQMLSAYFLVYAISWLFSLLISKSFPNKFIKLGQWLLLLIISGLIYWGSKGQF